MNGFFRKFECIFVNIVIIVLIVLIGVQVVMKNENAYQRIKEFEMTFKSLFQQGEVVEVAGNLDNHEEALQGVIVIDLLHDYSLPQVWLVKNGQRVENFAGGIVKVNVNKGDLLAIDARFCNQPLWFEITDISPEINTWQKDQQFRIYREEKRLGIVNFYEKL
ncbi:MAG: hypothetical protein ACOCQN_00915 [Halanaerobiaceae bacterium]